LENGDIHDLLLELLIRSQQDKEDAKTNLETNKTLASVADISPSAAKG